MARPKVLFVLTSQRQMGSADKETGWYLPEFAHPYYKLYPHSDIVVASPKGGEAPLDPSSVEGSKDEESVKFLNEKKDLWTKTEKLSDFKGKAGGFAAIFYVGGHGPMFDLATDPVSLEIIREFYEKDKIVSAVCHGPAALVNAKLADGSYILNNVPVTGFSNTEEDQNGTTKAMPFLLETELNKISGGKFEKAEKPWGPHVVVSGKIITGQNPASAAPLGDALVKAIKF